MVRVVCLRDVRGTSCPDTLPYKPFNLRTHETKTRTNKLIGMMLFGVSILPVAPNGSCYPRNIRMSDQRKYRKSVHCSLNVRQTSVKSKIFATLGKLLLFFFQHKHGIHQESSSRILVQVAIYHRLRIGRDGHLDQSDIYQV